MKCCMLQIRGGVERDRYGKKAGKGALVTWGRAPTLGVSQDATLIQMGGDRAMSEIKTVPLNSMVLGKKLKAGDRQTVGIGNEGDPIPTLQAAHHHAVAYNPEDPQSKRVYSPEGVAPCLSSGTSEGVNIQPSVLQMRYIVRRLTPTECERLMGLRDGWTIPSRLACDWDSPEGQSVIDEFRRIHDTFNRIMAEYEGANPPKPKTAKQIRKWLEKIVNPETCPDAPRYKGCGNGWATNQPRWILTRLLAADGINPFTGEEI